ncbi:MAG: gliding motility-associated C-terminal domain-containing protein [Sphingobacteriales bacterium]|nr:gliding motility-associated C-terminal domain-containing protein [Sphingobacteriales bacterium]MBI3718728.1 gliding motility-associated C-terminal domain-containing protein [Sphingobacteriales bacterium]
MKWICIPGLVLFHSALLKAQCPPNINFSTGDLSHWTASTGSFVFSPPYQIVYPANINAPTGTTGAVTIDEFNHAVPAVTVNTANSFDRFGSFETIPTLNGYNYQYSVTLGSTLVSNGGGGNSGYVRKIEYSIDVPPGLPTDPYIITYAYAMVLENGSHTTSSQPIFNATVMSPTGKIACASATYNLPTTFTGIVNNNGGRLDSIYEVDQTIAAQQGFTLSNVPSPNNNNRPNESLIRVWTKGWTEVMFNLAQYRGQTVTITYEADNCLPGGHFAYAYIAFRNDCGGPKITGPSPGCVNTPSTYSIPTLGNGTYTWTVPNGWQITSGANTNIITVKPGNTGGQISVTADNGCTKLDALLNVTLLPPTLPGNVLADVSVCTGNNSTTLNLKNNQGSVIKWIASTNNGSGWTDIGNANNNTYNAINLTTTTQYKAIVQNGQACSADTSTAAVIKVYEKSIGGQVLPADKAICLGQNQNTELSLTGNAGDVINWQWSDNGSLWNSYNPAVVSPTLNTTIQTVGSRYYRAIVKVGVCPADTSSAAKVTLVNANFPKAFITPKDTLICYGGTASLTTTIQTGTSYQWGNVDALVDPNNNKVPSLPHTFTASASPLFTTNYPISILNNGCPNAWTDTFNVEVRPPINPFAGNDTFIVVGQPLQLNVQSNISSGLGYLWTPSTGLSNTSIQNPIALLNAAIDEIIYQVKVTDLVSGCSENSSIKVRVFKTGPDVFVPNAFTPNNDNVNDFFRPIPVGISKINYFKVYNRYGQLVYSSDGSENSGWDGTLKGREQPGGVYAWVVSATTYTGAPVKKKGTVALIR